MPDLGLKPQAVPLDRFAIGVAADDRRGNDPSTVCRQAAGGGDQMPNSKAMAVSPLTNQLSGAGYGYDVLGNLVTMPAADGVGTVSMTYLDQGHIGTLTDASGVVWKYYYDADGKRRIKVKTAGGAATEPEGQGGVRCRNRCLRGAPEVRPDISRWQGRAWQGRPRPPERRLPTGGRAPERARGAVTTDSVHHTACRQHPGSDDILPERSPSDGVLPDVQCSAGPPPASPDSR